MIDKFFIDNTSRLIQKIINRKSSPYLKIPTFEDKYKKVIEIRYLDALKIYTFHFKTLLIFTSSCTKENNAWKKFIKDFWYNEKKQHIVDEIIEAYKLIE